MSPPPRFPEAGGPARALVAPSVIVREGYLLKRKEEPTSLATRFAFKKRYFWLSGETLSYSKSPEWQVGLQPTAEGFLAVASLIELPLCKLGETEAQEGTRTGQVQVSGQALLTPLGQCEHRTDTGIHLHTHHQMSFRMCSCGGPDPRPPPRYDTHRAPTMLSSPLMLPPRPMPMRHPTHLKLDLLAQRSLPGDIGTHTQAFVHGVLHQTFIECLLYTMQCSRHWTHSSKQDIKSLFSWCCH